MNRITVPVTGMHCQSCELTIGNKVKELKGISSVKVSRKKRTATVEFKAPASETNIHKAIISCGYGIGEEDTTRPFISTDPKEWTTIFFSIVVVAIGAVIISRTGLSNLSNSFSLDGNVWVPVLVGLAAGLSTCMALVGGLVLGVSAQYAQARPDATAQQKFTPHLFFNASRIVSFMVFGGIVGLFGSVLQLNNVFLGILMILVGIVMGVMGIQLTGIFPRLQSLLALPSFLTSRIGNPSSDDAYHHKNAVILGAVSFFLPCGFTQAMQLYAMSTGSFASGALVMGLFALGTAPGLLGVGGLTAAVSKKVGATFFRFVGVVVVAMSLMNITNGYQLSGIHPLSFLPQRVSSATSLVTDSSNETVLHTVFKLPDASVTSGYPDLISPKTFTTKVGKPTTLEVVAKDDGVGCMSTILIPNLADTPRLIKKGQTYRLSFVAKTPGEYPITCAMGVKFGTITVEG